MESHLLPDIPQDIVADILSRLPMKSLLRFKCVSKPWLSLISDPKFTFSNAKQKTIVMTWDWWGRSPSLYSIDEEAFVQQIIPKPWKRKRCDFQWRRFYKDEEVFVIGSCNGLLLIRLADNFFLWNPSTRKFIKVLTLDRLFRGDFQIIASGLCYDSYIDDYKAVLALGRQSIDHVLVASFKSKKWIQISFPYDIGSSKHGTLVNGFLHWRVKDTCEDRLCGPHKIVYFDPLTDEFIEFPIPKLDDSVKKVIIGLGVLSECLCMARCDYQSNYHELIDDIEVLTMKEYGVKGSWTTLFFISNLEVSPCLGDLMLLFLTNTGEILMMKDKKSILAYNPKEKSYWDIRIPNDELFYNGAATFVESLVSPHLLPLE